VEVLEVVMELEEVGEERGINTVLRIGKASKPSLPTMIVLTILTLDLNLQHKVKLRLIRRRVSSGRTKERGKENNLDIAKLLKGDKMKILMKKVAFFRLLVSNPMKKQICSHSQ